jgi:UDP-glucose 4-epimerase
MLRNEQLTIFGDGEQTRDFINVKDVVQANLKAAMAAGVSGAFNLGSASRVTINRLVELIGEAAGQKLNPAYGPERPGDVRHSLADVSAAANAFGFEPTVGLEEGLATYVAWAREEAASQ